MRALFLPRETRHVAECRIDARFQIAHRQRRARPDRACGSGSGGCRGTAGGYRRNAIHAPSSEKANELTSSTDSISPLVRSMIPSLFWTGFFAFLSFSSSASDMPIAYATQRESAENSPRPCRTPRLSPCPSHVSETRSSYVPLLREIAWASHFPSGESVGLPERLPFPEVSRCDRRFRLSGEQGGAAEERGGFHTAHDNAGEKALLFLQRAALPRPLRLDHLLRAPEPQRIRRHRMR